MKLEKIVKQNTIFICIFLLVTTVITSCKKEEPETININALQLEISDSTEQNPFDNKIDYWRPENKKICVIFGYDFNSPEIVSSYTELLQKNFGLTEEGGLIYTITYPDNFKHNGKYYVSELYSMLSEADGDLIGVIILGAPENTHTALGRLQDYWNMKLPYPIFSLFPQDEFLGMESTCDLVIDKLQTADETGNILSEEIVNKKISDAPEVLISCINYMKKMNGPFEKNNSIQAHIIQMLYGKKIQYYLDPETGLHAINHFILY